MPTNKTIFTADPTELVKAYQQIQRENLKLREESQKTAEEAKHHAEETESALDVVKESISEQVTELGKLAIGWVSVEKAVDLVKEAYERQIELAKQAAEATTETGASRASVIRNLGPISAAERREFFEQSEKIQLQTGFDEADMNEVLNYALSATGGNRERSLELAAEAGKFAPEGGAAAAQTARAIEQISFATGDRDIERSAGRLSQMQVRASIPDTENIAQYMTPAVQNMMAMGDSFEEATAAFAALAKPMGDFTGRRARTAGTTLDRAMIDFFDPEKQRKQVDAELAQVLSPRTGEEANHEYLAKVRSFLQRKGVKQTPQDEYQFAELAKELFDEKNHPEWAAEFAQQQAAEMPTPKTFEDRLHALQQSEDLKKRFRMTYTPDAQATGAELRLLEGGTQEAQLFDQTLKDLRGTDYREAEKQTTATIASEPTIALLKQKKLAEVAEEQMKAGDFKKAQIGLAQEALHKTLSQSNQGFFSGIGNWLRELGVGVATSIAGRDPNEVYAEQIREEIFGLKYDFQEESFYGADRHAHAKGVLSDEELAKRMGATRTADEERLRKAKISESQFARWQTLRDDLAGAAFHRAEEEATPAGEGPSPRKLLEHWREESEGSGVERGDLSLLDLSGEQLGGREKDLFKLRDEAKRAAYDLSHEGKFVEGKFDKDAPDHAPTETDLATAKALEKLAEQIERLIVATEHGNHQAAQEHRENQASSRSSGARMNGQRKTGRE